VLFFFHFLIVYMLSVMLQIWDMVSDVSVGCTVLHTEKMRVADCVESPSTDFLPLCLILQDCSLFVQ
jgi:hypothetical protein